MTAGTMWHRVSSAPATGMMPSAWPRSASASATPSSGSTLGPGRRSLSSTAASAKQAHSTTAMSRVALALSAATGGLASWAARFGPASAVTTSAAEAARPTRLPRSAHGAGSGAGPVPL